MFDFDLPEDGSEKRYHARKDHLPPFKKIRHYGWWVAHNAVAHPLMAFVPAQFAFDFHDWTSRKLNVYPRTKAHEEHLRNHS